MNDDDILDKSAVSRETAGDSGGGTAVAAAGPADCAPIGGGPTAIATAGPIAVAGPLPAPLHWRRRPRRKRYDWAEAARMLAEGASLADVALVLGCSRSAIWRALRRAPGLRAAVAGEMGAAAGEAGSRLWGARAHVADAVLRAAVEDRSPLVLVALMRELRLSGGSYLTPAAAGLLAGSLPPASAMAAPTMAGPPIAGPATMPPGMTSPPPDAAALARLAGLPDPAGTPRADSVDDGGDGEDGYDDEDDDFPWIEFDDDGIEVVEDVGEDLP